MLIRREYRRADDREPDVKRPSYRARQMYRVESPQNDEERDMERGRLVERLIEARQRGE
jgi:hypothetical protein